MSTDDASEFLVELISRLLTPTRSSPSGPDGSTPLEAEVAELRAALSTKRAAA